MKIAKSAVFLSLVGLACSAFGAQPVATVTSGGTIQLRGASVKTEAVPSWPVLAGDTISTSSSSALVRFLDGTTVTLSANSSAKVEQSTSGYAFRLSNGEMRIVPASSSSVSFYNGQSAVKAPSGTATTVTSAAQSLKTNQRTVVTRPGAPPPPTTVSTR